MSQQVPRWFALVLPHCNACYTQGRAQCPNHAYTQVRTVQVNINDTPEQIAAMRISRLEYYSSKDQRYIDQEPQRLERVIAPVQPFKSARTLFQE